MTSTDCPKLCFQRAPTTALRGTGSGFPQLVRETLSKNAMLPGLTYFYCNSASQGGKRGTRLRVGTASALGRPTLTVGGGPYENCGSGAVWRPQRQWLAALLLIVGLFPTSIRTSNFPNLSTLTGLSARSSCLGEIDKAEVPPFAVPIRMCVLG
jgi:hypothetical protein